MRLFIITLLLVCAHHVASAETTTRYVSLDGGHVSPFTSWENASTNIVTAIGEAGTDDLILISNGVYNLVEQLGAADYIDLVKRVTIRGFSTNREQVVLNGGGEKHAFRFWNHDCAGAVIDRMTISNCYASSGTATGGAIVMSRDRPLAVTITNVLFVNNRGTRGGAAYVTGVLITDCTFLNNTSPRSDTSSYMWAGGGAIYTPHRGGTVIRNSEFIGNRAENVHASSDGYGGAIMIREYCRNPPEDSDPVIENCVFLGNHAERHGGAVGDEADSGSTPRFINCIFISNSTDGVGGAISLSTPGNMVIEGGEIRDNTAAGDGGGVGCRSVSVSNLQIRDATISGNKASTGGGVYYTTGVNNIIENCIITHNFAGSGGGVRIVSASQSGGLLRNCIIADNTATNSVGGGVRALYGGRLINCLVAHNSSETGGGGLYIDRLGNYDGFVANTTIARNTAGGEGGGVHFGTDSGSINNWFTNSIVYHNEATEGSDDIRFHTTASVRANQRKQFFYSCAPAETELPADQENVSLDPLFVAVDGGNFRLRTGSPCINTGTNQPWMEDALDLDNRPRLDRFTGHVDMGCYEHVPRGFLFRLR